MDAGGPDLGGEGDETLGRGIIGVRVQDNRPGKSDAGVDDYRPLRHAPARDFPVSASFSLIDIKAIAGFAGKPGREQCMVPAGVKTVMRMMRILLMMGCLVVAMGGAAVLRADTATTDPAQAAARMDGLAAGFMTSDQVPGAIGALVLGDQVVLRGWGLSDIEAGTPTSPEDARFEIGSIAKLFTWLAVMMLVDEGAIDLQADVSTYLHEVQVPGTEPLTMAQLMSHRPGFEDSHALFDPEIGALPRPQALAASAPAQVMPRGEITAYSNWGVALAGQVVEDVSGMAYEDFLQERILTPLGMNATTYSEATARPDQPALSRSYRVQGGVANQGFRIDIGSFGPAGSAASTAADMARFLRFLLGDGALDGVRLLQPRTMAQMRTRLFDDRPQAADMAHGFQSRPFFGTSALGHAGGLNEFLSNLVFIPELGAGVFISQNGGQAARLTFLAPDLILADLVAEAGLRAPEAQPVPDALARAQEAAGRYLPNRRRFSGRTQLLSALELFALSAQEDGALIAPDPASQVMARFDPVAPDIWQDARGNRLMVLRDADGEVRRLADASGASSYERVTFATDPMLLLAALGLAGMLSLTTALGLIWRRGLKGGSRMGALVAALGVTAVGVVWLLLMAMGVVVALAAQLGMEYMIDQPQPTMVAVFVLADILAVLALILLVLLVVSRLPGWSVGRRLHHVAFVLVLAVTGALIRHWGLAFGGMG